MPHFKCVGCKTRLYSAARLDDLVGVGDLCPECGALLEPAGELAEVVGFRAIKPRDGTTAAGAPGTHQQMANRVGDLVARRKAIHHQAQLDAERWVDDSGSLSANAVELPLHETTS
jgi:hypothetical protein